MSYNISNSNIYLENIIIYFLLIIILCIISYILYKKKDEYSKQSFTNIKRVEIAMLVALVCFLFANIFYYFSAKSTYNNYYSYPNQGLPYSSSPFQDGTNTNTNKNTNKNVI